MSVVNVGAGLMVAALVATSAAAGTINQRERHQQQRIAQGARSGSLTAREIASLERQQAHIRAEEWRYRHNDGVLGPWERADLHRDLNRAGANIYRQKHDAQRR